MARRLVAWICVLFWWVFDQAASDKGCAKESFAPSNADLDVSRWEVETTADPAEMRSTRGFGQYTFRVSGASGTWPLWFSMTEGYPWSQPLDKARYDATHANVRLRSSDVTVASYPKTGTTWVEQIVLLLLHGSEVAPKLDPASRNSYNPGRKNVGCVWLEPMVASARTPRFSLEQFDRIPAPRVLKSHAPFGSLLGTRPASPPTAPNLSGLAALNRATQGCFNCTST